MNERVWGTGVYGQGKTAVLGDIYDPLPFCPLQIPRGLAWDETLASVVNGLRLTAWTCTICTPKSTQDLF